MSKRFISIWFRHLLTDWLALRRPELKAVPFVLAAPVHNRMVIIAANNLAEAQGITAGTTAADAKAVIPDLLVIDAVPGQAEKILKAAGGWCIRYSPVVAIDLPNGLIINASGCAHLWGGEEAYLQAILTALKNKGYHVRGAMASTIGAAWAMARYGSNKLIIPPADQATALLALPPIALRLESLLLERLHKLGFYTIQKIAVLPRRALQRRFGMELLLRLDQAFGHEEEHLEPLNPPEPYHVRLPFLEPIRTPEAIAQAILKLLEMMCLRLRQEGKGLRSAILKGYRIDGKLVNIAIGTNRPVVHIEHLFKLFELKIPQIEPALGIELFTLDAPRVEDLSADQEALWASDGCGLNTIALSELLDRLANKLGTGSIQRYLPQERYWPEHTIRLANTLTEQTEANWRIGKPRPTILLPKPERIEVTALLPDNPPMLFIYKGVRHIIRKADDAERIEREWWRDKGQHRDYYVVEDQEGRRYWLFRSGHYNSESSEWYIHGFFA
ncbi:DNA polymerase Y family protein [Mucilaginibacter sp. PAMB04274]|uniref:Y-family DNA polymerase n=1 Tax=Mucilaginibacter sp. PAMB04274 TaxID=3138568 RepID=UPI0031F695EB